MKKHFVNYCIKQIKKYYNYDETKIEELKYGLSSIYLTVTKTIIMFILACFLGIVKEMLLILLFYNALRLTGFGLHAKKSWQCWVSTILIFLILPLVTKTLIIDQTVKIVLYILFIFLIFKYAPADTEKRPIISQKRRTIYKLLCTSTSFIFLIIILTTTNNLLSNSVFFGTLIEVIMISPITYRIFKLKYNNYKEYMEKHKIISI